MTKLIEGLTPAAPDKAAVFVRGVSVFKRLCACACAMSMRGLVALAEPR